MKKIMNGDETSKMLQNPFTVEVYIPKRRHGDISQLMDSMRKRSEWISESKTRAANKTISRLLSIWLNDTLSHSKPEKRNDRAWRPTLTETFTYLFDISRKDNFSQSSAFHEHHRPQIFNIIWNLHPIDFNTAGECSISNGLEVSLRNNQFGCTDAAFKRRRTNWFQIAVYFNFF